MILRSSQEGGIILVEVNGGCGNWLCQYLREDYSSRKQSWCEIFEMSVFLAYLRNNSKGAGVG